MEGAKAKEEQCIRDENGVLLRYQGEIGACGEGSHTLLSSKSPKVDPAIVEQRPEWPVALRLEALQR